MIFEKELQKIPAELHEPVRKAFETPEAKRTPEQKTLFEKYPKINVRAGIIDQYDPKAMAELKKAQVTIDAKRAEKPKEDFYAIMSEVPSKIPATKLFHRGDYRQPLQEIIPGIYRLLQFMNQNSGIAPPTIKAKLLDEGWHSHSILHQVSILNSTERWQTAYGFIILGRE